jgi:hypothetical protein
MDGYGVDIGSLVAAGGEFIDLADEAREAKAEFTGAVETHDGANEGFTTTGKAGLLASRWEFQIDDLCKRTAMAGGLLQDSAQGYEQMEDAVIATLPPLSAAG